MNLLERKRLVRYRCAPALGPDQLRERLKRGLQNYLSASREAEFADRPLAAPMP